MTHNQDSGNRLNKGILDRFVKGPKSHYLSRPQPGTRGNILPNRQVPNDWIAAEQFAVKICCVLVVVEFLAAGVNDNEILGRAASNRLKLSAERREPRRTGSLTTNCCHHESQEVWKDSHPLSEISPRFVTFKTRRTILGSSTAEVMRKQGSRRPAPCSSRSSQTFLIPILIAGSIS